MSAPRWVLAAVVVAGCGTTSAVLRSPSGTPPHGPRMDLPDVAGLRVSVVPRPTPGFAHLSLWLDAGSRDGELPQLALVASLVASRGGDVHARVVPDGTELSTTCASEDLERCTARLAAALATRAPTDEALASALAELRRRRAAALADEGRRAEELAFEALLGDEAKALFPLGRAADDGRVTAGAVRDFLAAHYGPQRALLVALGDVDASALAGATQASFGGSPRASAPRRPARALDPTGGLALEVGAGAHVVAALPVADAATASRIAERLVEPAADGLGGESLEVRAFSIRGLSLVMARASGQSPPAWTRDLVFELLQAARADTLEGALADTAPIPADPLAAARHLGEEFAAGADAPGSLPRDLTVAVGAVVPGGRADRLERDDPDATTRARALTELRAAMDDALGWIETPLRRETLEGGVAGTLPNGATVRVLARPTDPTVGVVVRVAGGAAEESPKHHGLTSVLAEVVARGCRRRLASVPHARVEGWADPAGWGVRAGLPRAELRPALDAVLRCALAPRVPGPLFEDVRLEHLGASGREGSAPWLGSLAAAAVAPAAPGSVAPDGNARSLVTLRRRDLQTVVDRSLSGARVTVAVVGDVEAEATASRIAAVLARLPEGTPLGAIHPGPSSDRPQAAHWERSGIVAVVSWRMTEGAASAEGAAAFARAAAARVAGAGMPVLWQSGGAAPWGAWAAIAVRVAEAELDALPARVDANRPSRADAERWLAADEGSRRWRTVDPVYVADLLTLPAPEGEDATGTFEALGRSPARFVIVRDQPAPALASPVSDPSVPVR